MLYKNSKMDVIYYDAEPASFGTTCQVRLDEHEILIDYIPDGETERVLYKGEEKGKGHYHLHGHGFKGDASLHCFDDSKKLEGCWIEDGVKGMWVIELRK